MIPSSTAPTISYMLRNLHLKDLSIKKKTKPEVSDTGAGLVHDVSTVLVPVRCGGYKKQQGFHGLCLQYGDPRRFCLTGSSFVLMSWEGGFLILVAIMNSLRAS